MSKTEVTLQKKTAEEDLNDRMLKAVEPELAEAGVDPEQVRLVSLDIPVKGYEKMSIEVKPR